MSTYAISRQWMNHSGGTKFYQLFRIIEAGANSSQVNSAAVGHYGPLSALSSASIADRRPIAAGQVTVYAGEKHDALLHEKTRPRSGGRYVPEKVASPTVYIDGEEDLLQWLRTNMPTRAREPILQYLGLRVDPNAQPINDDDHPRVEPETISHAPGEEPAGWGDW